MQEIISYLKDVAERGAASGTNNCYIVKDGNIYARNQSLQAGIPWPSKVSFTLNADAVDAALSRMKGDVKIKIERDAVIFKCGRLTTTIDRIHETPPVMPEIPRKGWKKSPPGLAAALKLAKPFLGDRSWQQAVRLYEDRVTAFSGHGGVDITVPGLGHVDMVMLTEKTINFIIAQGDPDEWVVDDLKCWIVRWDDGRWVRSQQLIEQMDERQIAGLFERAGTEAPVKLTDEWRGAVEDAEALSDTVVQVSAKGLRGKKANITTDIELDIDVGPDHASFWKGSLMRAMFDVADAWNPDAYRGKVPAYFCGKNARGMLAGFAG